MYIRAGTKPAHIRAACRGKAPDPYAACGRKVCAATGRRKDKVAQKEEMHHLHIELTPDQYQMLTEKAKQCRTSKRMFLIQLMEGERLQTRPTQELKDLRTEIHRIGNNINQIARSVNAGIADPQEAKRGLRMLDEVYELMYQIAKR